MMTRLSVVVACVALLLPTAASAAPPEETAGTAPGVEVTARWWQVALASGDFSFWEDSSSGGNCRVVMLPSGPVVMAAGTLGGGSDGRSCAVPAGATVVLPVLNSIYLLTDPRPLDTVGEARRELKATLADATVSATVNGDPVAVSRKRSSAFTVSGAALGLGPLQAVSDGYWLFWEPSPGTYVVETSGTAGEFSSATIYTFEVG